ncbi:MAG: carboxylate-amine ligase [Cyclobacteriaceae bacterium]
MVQFRSSPRQLTFGVEVELQVLDNKTLDLVPRAAEILNKTSISNLSKELFQSTIELITPVYEEMGKAEEFFEKKFAILQEEGNSLDLVFSATGTHPFANYTDRLITPSRRYYSIVSQNRWLIRRMAVYGMHVHLGMRSGEECIRFHNFFMRFIPHLIALSASSPFWHGLDTELFACRPTMYEALPTAGIPYQFDSWEEYQRMIDNLIRIGSIRSLKDIWWDIRPSPDLGTLEIRICDAPASRMELLAIVAFIQVLGFWFADRQEDQSTYAPLPLWVLRENKWRSIRDGMNASIILPGNHDIRLLNEDIKYWAELLYPYYQKLNYLKYYQNLISILDNGNSSMRQRKKFHETLSLESVVKMNTLEFSQGKPLL